MTILQFDRTYELRAGAPANAERTVPGPGRAWTDLKINFDVKRTTGKDPNKAKITLTNPDESAVAFLEQATFIQLLAGYGPHPSLIFSGSITKRGVTIEQRSTDKQVTIEAGDGEFAWQRSRFDWHFEAGTSNRTILTQLTRAMGVGFGPGQVEIPIRTYSTDVTFFGPARDAVDELVTDLGGTWSIQDGNLVILLEGQGTAEQAVVLNSDSGLVGYPAKTEDGVNITALLNPLFRPGRFIRLESRRVSGFFKAERVTHKGDSRSRSWISQIEAVPVEAV